MQIQLRQKKKKKKSLSSPSAQCDYQIIVTESQRED